VLLRRGTDPGILDSGGHTPLYRAANECGLGAGPEVVRALVRAGADVNACGAVTRRSRALLDCGTVIEARDSKGDTPLQRAINCRKDTVVRLLAERGAARATR